MLRNTHIGLLPTLLQATADGRLNNLSRFTPDQVAPKIKRFIKSKLAGRQLSQSMWYAKRKGFLATQEKEGKLNLVLTYKGRERLLAIKRQTITVKRPKKWDGKWRMVAFDIPEKRRFARDTLRNALKKIGFQKLEGSLWIYPFDAQEELGFLAETLLLKPFVRHFVITKFDGEEEWRDKFRLNN